MRLHFFKIFILLIPFAVFSCSQIDNRFVESKDKKSEEIIFVKIPPQIDLEKATDEDLYRISQSILYSSISKNSVKPDSSNILQNRKEKNFSLPNDDSFLKLCLKQDVVILTLGASWEIYKPSKQICSTESTDTFQISKINSLENKLREIFYEREKAGVYLTNSDKIIKNIYIDAPLKSKFGDVMKILSVAKNARADPIFLKIDKLND